MRNTNRSESGTSLYDDEDVKKIVTDTMRNDNYTTEEDSSDRNAFENRSSGIINVLQPRSSGVINTINREGREGREDHRLKSYAQGVDATASRRMREHINSDSEDKAKKPFNYTLFHLILMFVYTGQWTQSKIY
jgi:hypothetical protein